MRQLAFGVQEGQDSAFRRYFSTGCRPWRDSVHSTSPSQHFRAGLSSAAASRLEHRCSPVSVSAL